MFTIDLHVHTQNRSSCGKSSEEEQIEAAIQAGLHGLVFSDHDRLAPPERLQELNARYAPFKIFGGIEVTAWDQRHPDEFEHVLVLGVQDPLLEGFRWSYPALYDFVRARDGFLAVAHLFRFFPESRLDLRVQPPDALEAYSNNIAADITPRIRRIAGDLGLPVVSNSDGHHTRFIGRHGNVLNRIPADELELIALLKAGEFTCMFPDDSKNTLDIPML